MGGERKESRGVRQSRRLPCYKYKHDIVDPPSSHNTRSGPPPRLCQAGGCACPGVGGMGCE